jgi:uncharacterized membrane protein YadS
MRVLTLGPVCVVLSLTAGQLRGETEARIRPPRQALHRLVPWFVIGFLVMVLLRSADLIPVQALVPIGEAATILTIISMAALGLGVDVRAVSRAGGPVTATVILSLLALGSVSFALILLLGL